jgi:pyruvate,water dikinase
MAAAPPNDDSRTGLGCCAGIVEAPVVVVRDPRNAAPLDGAILVAERTDPAWVVLFSSARGLLIERGSVLSHSAIIAREMGIPTIVSVAGVTGWLRDGDLVRMDGSTGVVRRVSGEAGHAS